MNAKSSSKVLEILEELDILRESFEYECEEPKEAKKCLSNIQKKAKQLIGIIYWNEDHWKEDH